METITVSSKGQVVIPEEIRKRHRIKKGTKFILVEDDGRLILQKEEVVNKLLKKMIKATETKEDFGYLALAEENLKDIWENKKDEKIWKKYL